MIGPAEGQPTTACLPVPGGKERRQEARHPCRQAHVCRILVRPSFQPRYALLDNVSARGVGLVLSCRLRSGTVLALRLPGLRPGLSCTQSATVQHFRRYEPWGWLHGCSLGRPLSDEELAVLV
jgi:hypothetical protein